MASKTDIDIERVALRRITAQDTVALRHSILWPNHPVSHVLLPEDDQGSHYGAFLIDDSMVPVAVISVFREAVPSTADAPQDSRPAARIRKFACDKAYQGHGIGTKLLQHVFEVAATELACQVIWCDARRETLPWYERRGMQGFGDIFQKSAVEYVRMKKILGTGSDQSR